MKPSTEQPRRPSLREPRGPQRVALAVWGPACGGDGSWGCKHFPVSQSSSSPTGPLQGEEKPHKRVLSRWPDVCLKGGCVKEPQFRAKISSAHKHFMMNIWNSLNLPGTQRC